MKLLSFLVAIYLVITATLFYIGEITASFIMFGLAIFIIRLLVEYKTEENETSN